MEVPATAQKMLNEVLKCKPVKPNDIEALRRFVVDLEMVHKRAAKTDRATAFDSQDALVSVLKKVEFLQNKWSENCLKRAEKWDSSKGPITDPVFSDLVTFLKRQDKLGSFKTTYATKTPEKVVDNRNQRTPAAQVASASASTPTTHKTPSTQKNNPRSGAENGAGAKPKAATLYKNAPAASQSTPQEAPTTTIRVTPANWACWVCHGKEFHGVDQCVVFKSMSVEERCDTVRNLELCMNCLRKGHIARDCTRTWTCQQCKKKHHTSIHKNFPSANAQAPQSSS